MVTPTADPGGATWAMPQARALGASPPTGSADAGASTWIMPGQAPGSASPQVPDATRQLPPAEAAAGWGAGPDPYGARPAAHPTQPASPYAPYTQGPSPNAASWYAATAGSPARPAGPAPKTVAGIPLRLFGIFGAVVVGCLALVVGLSLVGPGRGSASATPTPVPATATGAPTAKPTAPPATAKPAAPTQPPATAKPAAATVPPKPAATTPPPPPPKPAAAATTPAAPPTATRVPVSLANGADITPPRGERGLGKLTVKNGTNRDAVVKLVEDTPERTTRRFVYVRANNEVVLENVQKGTYRLLFMTGIDWDTNARKFLREARASQFEEPFAFNETPTERGTRFDTWEVSLNSVPGGTGRTTTLPDDAFGTD